MVLINVSESSPETILPSSPGPSRILQTGLGMKLGKLSGLEALMSFAMLSNLCGSCLIFLVFKIVNVLTIDFVASSNRLDVELQILYSHKNKSMMLTIWNMAFMTHLLIIKLTILIPWSV